MEILKHLKRDWFRYGFETLAVIVGILVAFALENWNSDRNIRMNETLLLEEIHAEFLLNREEIESNIMDQGLVRFNCEQIIEMFPIDVKEVNIDTLSSHFGGLRFRGDVDFKHGTIITLKNTSSFETISNKELRTLLIQFDDLITDFSDREKNSLQFLMNFFLPYLDARIPRPYPEGIKQDRVDLNFLSSIEFENMIKRRSGMVNSFLQVLVDEESDLVRSINRIIELSAPE